MSDVFDRLFPNIIFEERVLNTSAYSTMPNAELRVLMEQYREIHPEDPAGVHFNKNMKIAEWDE